MKDFNTIYVTVKVCEYLGSSPGDRSTSVAGYMLFNAALSSTNNCKRTCNSKIQTLQDIACICPLTSTIITTRIVTSGSLLFKVLNHMLALRS